MITGLFKMQEEINCKICGRQLTKDEQGLNKKILEGDVKNDLWRCLSCMSEYLECEQDELREKIEEFKAEGCKLFS